MEEGEVADVARGLDGGAERGVDEPTGLRCGRDRDLHRLGERRRDRHEP